MSRMARGRRQQRGVSEAGVEVLPAERDSSFPHLVHVDPSDPHSLESPPRQRAEVFSMQIGSQVGAVVPLYFLGEAVGWEGCEPLLRG